MEQLHELVIAEGKNFFDRLVGVSSQEEMKKLEVMTKPGDQKTDNILEPD